MAMKCASCGAENPQGKKFCGDCGRRMTEQLRDESLSGIVQETKVRKLKTHSPLTTSEVNKKRGMAWVVAAIVVLAVVALILAYYYQPVRGSLSPRQTTFVNGQSISFDFTPSQGIPPYSYLWSFGDGTTSAEKSPVHAYESTGTYSVTVTVTDKAGVSGSWSTTITVRLPLVFIDSVSYPSSFSNPLGDTRVVLFVDGAQVAAGATLQPGTSHSIRLQIIWVTDFGIGQPLMLTVVDDDGTVAVPTTTTDLHCVLDYNPSSDPMFALVAG
jgi:hypothetical protein